MLIISTIVTMVLLGWAALLDIRDRQFYLFIPVLMILVNSAAVFFATGKLISMNEIFIIISGIMISLICHQKIGLGDVLIMAGLMPLCHLPGCVRIISDGIMIMGGWLGMRMLLNPAERKETREIAFVPFILIGFTIWAVI